MVDEEPPIRWRVRVEDKMGTLVYHEFPLSPGTELEEKWGLYTTDTLLTRAKEFGYDDWYVPPEDFVPTWEWPDIGDESKKKLTPKYPLPDSAI